MKNPVEVSDVYGGPGWVISGENFLPKVTNLSLFRKAISDDPLREAIELLWLGNPSHALCLLELQPVTTRQKALRADCLRDLGSYDESAEIYLNLISETSNSRLEATFRQHLGKVYLSSGEYQLAKEQFLRALTLRKTAHVPENLIASFRQACTYVSRILKTI